jgi:hypothetical protein
VITDDALLGHPDQLINTNFAYNMGTWFHDYKWLNPASDVRGNELTEHHPVIVKITFARRTNRNAIIL